MRTHTHHHCASGNRFFKRRHYKTEGRMRSSPSLVAIAIAAIALLGNESDAFAPTPINNNNNGRWLFDTTTKTTTTSLFAIGALAKNAKKAELRKYVENGIEESVVEKIKLLKEGLANAVDLHDGTVGPLQEALTKRKGTITVIAEYKRKMDAAESGYIDEIFDPDILSSSFRKFGASAIAVMADERMGGCNYGDIAKFVEEQRRARVQVPGPLGIINNDLIIDELQVARTAAYGAKACVITYDVVVDKTSDDKETDHGTLETLLKSCKILDIEAIVAVSDAAEAQAAIDRGARLLLVGGIDGPEQKQETVAKLRIPEGQHVCTIANVKTNNDKQLQEIEEAWALRDKGFNCAWVGEALYKGGSDPTEHPGAIIKAMKSKSSLKWASPKAYGGKGEGAREYLGDILM